MNTDQKINFVVAVSVIQTLVLALAGIAYFRTSTVAPISPVSETHKAFILQKQNSVHDRVVTVVQTWATTPSLPTDKQDLDVLWATSGKSFEFYPSATQILTAQLQHEFRDSKSNVLQYTDIYADANTAGKVKTVSDLATAVRQNYDPQ